MNSKQFSKKIIEWYKLSHRQLPWRATNDPYKIWLAEIILQQTRVAQGLPYYLKFLKKFPHVQALASAPEREVLRQWQGLGYYTRARNLHACAKKIVKHYGGKFPQRYEELLALPGVGPYTAAAVASIAFSQPVAVVDGNVYRILARIFGIDQDINSNEGKKIFQAKANELIDRNHPGVFNQAMMELGAIQCSPKSPDCLNCTFRGNCVARMREITHLLPVKSKKVKVAKRFFTYLVLSDGKKLAMRRRDRKDIWRGLYDFHLIETMRYQKVDQVMKRSGLRNLAGKIKVELLQRTRHLLTHQVIDASFVRLRIEKSGSLTHIMKAEKLKFFTPSQVRALPKPTLISRFLDENNILE
jgi:A/G-specific adenine glycosylase